MSPAAAAVRVTEKSTIHELLRIAAGTRWQHSGRSGESSRRRAPRLPVAPVTLAAAVGAARRTAGGRARDTRPHPRAGAARAGGGRPGRLPGGRRDPDPDDRWTAPQLTSAADHSKLWVGTAAVLFAVGGRKGRRAALTGVAAIASDVGHREPADEAGRRAATTRTPMRRGSPSLVVSRCRRRRRSPRATPPRQPRSPPAVSSVVPALGLPLGLRRRRSGTPGSTPGCTTRATWSRRGRRGGPRRRGGRSRRRSANGRLKEGRDGAAPLEAGTSGR